MKPRSRLIHPGLFDNETLADLGLACQLLFAGLPTIVDREGRIKDRPRTIKSKIFPHDDKNAIDIDKCLSKLNKAGFIVRYRADEIDCIFIPTFAKYQTVHQREAASELPPPEIGEVKQLEIIDKEDLAQQKKQSRAAKRKKAAVDLDATIPYEKIIGYLNEITGRNFQHKTALYRNRIRTLWNNGIRIEDFMYVVKVKWLEWKDGKMRKHLNPNTLFGDKFDIYRNQEMPNLTDDMTDDQRINAKVATDYMVQNYGQDREATEGRLDSESALGIDEHPKQAVDDGTD